MYKKGGLKLSSGEWRIRIFEEPFKPFAGEVWLVKKWLWPEEELKQMHFEQTAKIQTPKSQPY